jgi:undecaprenyl-diphosphatase
MMQFDLALFNAIHRFWGTSRVLDAFGVFLANTLTYLMVIGMAVFIFQTAHSNRERIFVAAQMLLAFILSRGILTTTIQYFADRSRPFKVLGFAPPFEPLTSGAMPSGHTSALFSIAFVMFTVDPRWGAVYLVLSLLVGLGRVFVGVHWPSDVLVGMLVGLASGFFVYKLLTPQRKEIFTDNSPTVGL